jgi:hypothetical protein
MGGQHVLSDEVRWMLEEEEYASLKAELKKKEWKVSGRKGFFETVPEGERMEVSCWDVEIDDEQKREGGTEAKERAEEEALALSQSPVGEVKITSERPTPEGPYLARRSSLLIDAPDKGKPLPDLPTDIYRGHLG